MTHSGGSDTHPLKYIPTKTGMLIEVLLTGELAKLVTISSCLTTRQKAASVADSQKTRFAQNAGIATLCN